MLLLFGIVQQTTPYRNENCQLFHLLKLILRCDIFSLLAHKLFLFNNSTELCVRDEIGICITMKTFSLMFNLLFCEWQNNCFVQISFYGGLQFDDTSDDTSCARFSCDLPIFLWIVDWVAAEINFKEIPSKVLIDCDRLIRQAAGECRGSQADNRSIVWDASSRISSEIYVVDFMLEHRMT